MLPVWTAHIILKAEPPSSNGFLLDKTSHSIMPHENTSHFSVYVEPSNTWNTYKFNFINRTLHELKTN